MMGLESIEYLQINLQHSKAATDELIRKDSSYLIAFIQEPYLYRDKPHFSSASSKTSVSASPSRACLRIDRSLPSWEVAQFTSQDMATALIRMESQPDSSSTSSQLKNVYVSSVYLDIQIDISEQLEFKSLLNHCNTHRIPLIVGCDSNAHSPLWGCEVDNERGRALEEIIDQYHLSVHNSGSDATFVSTRASSIIDVTLTNRWYQLHFDLYDWEVDKSLSFSDHRYIKFSSGFFKPLNSSHRPFLKADWARFYCDVACKIDKLPPASSTNLHLAAQSWTDMIRSSMDEILPLQPTKCRRPVPWWTAQLSKKRRNLLRLHHKVRRGRGSPALQETFRERRKAYKALIRKAKRDSWRTFCSEYCSVKDISNIINAVKPKTTKDVGLITNHFTGLPPSSPEESITNLLQVHFPDGQTLSPEDPIFLSWNQGGDEELDETDSLDTIDGIITMEKIKESISSFSSFKAAGPDEISPCILQHLPDGALEYLRILFIRSLRMGIIPGVWTEMRVVFIPKPNKDSYDIAKSFRPITLSSFVLKTLERLIHWYLSESHLSLQPLVSQHAFQVGLSTESALSEAVDFIEEAVYNRRIALAVSLDCSGAFDNINFDSAEKSLIDLGVRTEVVQWYSNLLRHRKVFTKVKDVIAYVLPKRGSPQGGVLSPTIWNLTLNNLLSQFQNGPVKVVGYADDVLLLLHGDDIEEMVTIMEPVLQMVADWGRSQGLTFNPGKTVATIFSWKKNLDSTDWPDLHMNGESIPLTNSLPYLGLILDKSLTWSDHIKTKIKKVKKLSHLIKGTIGMKWGLRPIQAMWTYTAIIKPMVLYGSIVWSHNLPGYTQELLTRLQRWGMLSFCNPLRSTPTRAMEILFNLPPLYIEAQRLATLARIRTKSSYQSTTWGPRINKMKRQPHTKFHDDIIKSLLPDTDLDITKRTKVWGISIPDRTQSNQNVIYTDGSKSDGNAGTGFCVTKDDSALEAQSISLAAHNTVFQAEVLGIREALSWIRDNSEKWPIGGYRILTDSQAALNALKQRNTYSSLVLSTKNLIKDLMFRVPLSIAWIKGHADNTGNEYADYLAKEGTTSDNKMEVGLSTSFIKSTIREYYSKVWQHSWNVYPAGRQSKQLMPNAAFYHKYHLVGYSKNIINRLIQFFTGHSILNRHLSLLGHMVPTDCRRCGEAPEAPKHLLEDCPAFTLQRSEAILDHQPGSNYDIKVIHNYLQSTSLFNWLGSDLDQGL